MRPIDLAIEQIERVIMFEDRVPRFTPEARDRRVMFARLRRVVVDLTRARALTAPPKRVIDWEFDIDHEVRR